MSPLSGLGSTSMNQTRVLTHPAMLCRSFGAFDGRNDSNEWVDTRRHETGHNDRDYSTWYSVASDSNESTLSVDRPA